ncbi:MAG: hypothetical protein ACK4NC_03045 [Candidatus Gracilibacteria bacterium]
MNPQDIPEILPAGMDEERFLEMEGHVLRVMDMNEHDKMAEPIEAERGELRYFCKNKDCTQNTGPYTLDYDPETTYKAPICPACGGSQVSLGTRESIVSHFRIK